VDCPGATVAVVAATVTVVIDSAGGAVGGFASPPPAHALSDTPTRTGRIRNFFTLFSPLFG
jgi:hypothetical protein